ncbi:MAG: hypothetical protein ABSF26_00765 [Thermoguttaceae bacterium]|jgi:hypothetical protein
MPITKLLCAGLCGCLLAAGNPSLAAQRSLTIKDNLGRGWVGEPITWELPGVKADKVLVKRDGNAIPAQVVATADGVRLLAIIDRLAQDASTTLTADLDAQGPTAADLSLATDARTLVLANKYTAVRLNNGRAGNVSPILGVRTASGKWTGGGEYDTKTAQPVSSKTVLLEKGPVRLAARVTTTFDNGRTHTVTVGLWSGSHSIDVDETFDVGPDDKYQFKKYADDKDELAWEWWSWYGDREGVEETHPNNWVFRLTSDAYRPNQITYYGQASTDTDKGKVTIDNHNAPLAEYTLANGHQRRLEKYLAGHTQWRPDAVLWYLTSPTKDDGADAVAVYTHSVRNWRNPNVLPTPKGITLRTGANDMRVISRQGGRQLEIECPIGLGRRLWAIRISTRKEMLAPAATSPTALDAERVQRCMGLDITRHWITDWAMNNQYPRLFIKPDEKEAYYARLKGRGIDAPGNTLDFFLRHQDQPNFDRDFDAINKQADLMISGYWSHGMDNTCGYPGWMLGYWHAMVVAGGVDNLCGAPLCTPQQARRLKKKLAILTYALVSPDAWPDKQINYGWGSMNMPVARWGGRAIIVSALSDHPMAKAWLKDAGRYFRMLLETEYAADGTHISCPHYIGASITSFYSWIAMANSGLAADMSTAPALQKFARYYMQLMKPIDLRWGIRVLMNEGDTRPGSSSLPAILARFFKRTDPELAGQLMQLWNEGGRDLSGGMGIPDALVIDPAIPPRPLRMGPQVNRGFGAFLRYRQLGTPEEAYLAFVGGNFMIDHTNTDQLGFTWNEKGVPLTDFEGAMYVPMACTAVSHTTLAWDVRPGGAPDPGKDRPGNWYHDHNQPFVDLNGVTPRLHWQIGFDQKTEAITETRGLVTLAADAPGAALLEGQVVVKSLAEIPTRQDNYAIAIAAQAWPPSTPLDEPFTWMRRVLYVKAARAAGMNYLVVRDDLGGFEGRTPNFNGWWFADDVYVAGRSARYTGQFGVDTDLYVAVPSQVKLYKDTFIHNQCEPIVGSRHQAKFGKPFSEKQVLCRVEGQKGQGFLLALFPYKPNEPRPTIENWQGQRGVKIGWKGETHYILLDTRQHEIDADGIKARAACLVVKVTNAQNFTLELPDGGRAAFRGQKVEGQGPLEIVVADGKAHRSQCTDLMNQR